MVYVSGCVGAWAYPDAAETQLIEAHESHIHPVGVEEHARGWRAHHQLVRLRREPTQELGVFRVRQTAGEPQRQCVPLATRHLCARGGPRQAPVRAKALATVFGNTAVMSTTFKRADRKTISSTTQVSIIVVALQSDEEGFCCCLYRLYAVSKPRVVQHHAPSGWGHKHGVGADRRLRLPRAIIRRAGKQSGGLEPERAAVEVLLGVVEVHHC
jgi:hypothetical protein